MEFDEIIGKETGIEILNLMAPKLMKWHKDAKEKRLPSTKVELLSKKIEALPIEGQSLLFGNYVFDLNSESMEILYEINDPDMHLVFFEHLLSEIMGIQEGERISDISMEKACKKALSRIADAPEMISFPERVARSFGKVVAAILIVGIISFGTALAVNAEFRDSVIRWFMEATKQYTLFRLENENELDSSELKKFIPSYIPERYHLYSRDVVTGFATYTYVDVNGDLLDVSICMPEANAYLNTEGMKKEVITINGQQAFLYHDGVHGSLATSIDGYALYVTGKANRDDFIKIAENVVKK
ncbi:protein of unknown function [Butyrivibrio sp. ob235]|uniref:DUF4367 domain-containing protein n=1 Tax=Butyrivibrio sp. ob235 TaxID=1761780 RepID=UPI0008C4E466|nr:DUF4367 domain-containing protein [Butyrivibrio sp. ob235]SEL13987.1 protein of unknown function [Butyrivibrio sp. ob235]